MKLSAIGISAMLAAASAPVSADFQIQYQGGGPTSAAASGKVPATKSNTVVLLDKAFRHVTEYGSPEPEYVTGEGTAVNLPLALQMLMPSGWRVVGSSSEIGRDATMDWRDGESLVDVLGRAGAANGLHFHVDWNQRLLTLRPGQSRGLYDELVTADASAATLVLSEPASTATPAAAAEVAQLPSGASSMVPIAAPVPAPVPVPEQSIEVFRGESIREIARRLSGQLQHSRALLDLDNGSLASAVAVTPARIVVSGYDRIQRGLVESFGEKFRGIKVRPAADPTGGSALVITDRDYAEPYRLRLFEVRPGSLRENAAELAKAHGWAVPERYGWQLAVDYTQHVAYPVVASNLAEAYQRLFAQYPVQAQLIDGTNSVVFVSRDLPVSER